jgi:hypothetical protein
MVTELVTAFELSRYWNALAKSENPETITIINWWQLPSWNEICSELTWHKYLLDGGNFSKKRHGYCGVYRLIGLATDGEIEATAALDRVCGKDTTGTLYIGQTGWLNERLNKMRLYRHNASIALSGRTPLGNLFPSNKLAIALYFTDPTMTNFIEENLIQAYMVSFGEAPPLNYRVKPL